MQQAERQGHAVVVRQPIGQPAQRRRPEAGEQQRLDSHPRHDAPGQRHDGELAQRGQPGRQAHDARARAEALEVKREEGVIGGVGAVAEDGQRQKQHHDTVPQHRAQARAARQLHCVFLAWCA